MHEKIIVLDDEPLILSTIEKALGKAGYEVIAVSGPEEFRAALAAGPAKMIIVDLHLGGVDAFALIAWAEDLVPGLKTLVVSGSPDKVEHANFLEKPFKIVELRSMVRKILDEPD